MRAVELLKRQHREAADLIARARSSGEGRERIQLLGLIAEALTIHAALEEQHLYPLVRESGLLELANASEQEHMEVKRLVARLLGLKRRDPAIDQVLARLEESVRAHVAKEEEQLFPRIEERLDATVLETAGADMERSESRLRAEELLELAEERGAAV